VGSVARSRRADRARSAGFTLIEILVVMVVVGIALALVTVNLGGDDRRTVGSEAKRLAGAIEYAAALAQWRAETLGVSVDGNGYRFWRRGAEDRWVAFSGDEVLAPYRLPAGVAALPVSYAGAPVAPDAILPLRASGRNEPLAIRVDGGNARALVASDPLNRVAYSVAAANAAVN
jgi:general secretion pathway protein H